MNKKGFGAGGMITLVVVLIGILVTSILMSFITDSILDPFSEKIESMSPQASENVDFIQASFVSFWDYVIIIAFLINVLVLLISAFMVDTHPVFLVLYIGALFFTFVFTPEIMVVVDRLFEGTFSSQLTQLPLTNFLRVNFGIIMLGVAMLSGIVMYVKFKVFGSNP